MPVATEALIAAVQRIIGLLFLTSGVLKVLRPREFRTAIAGYRLLHPSLIGPTCLAVIVAELLVGIGLVLWLWLPATTIVAVTLLLLFIIVMAQAMVRGLRNVNCGCMIGRGDQRIGYQLIARNLILVLLLVLPWLAGKPSRYIAAGVALSGLSWALFTRRQRAFSERRDITKLHPAAQQCSSCGHS